MTAAKALDFLRRHKDAIRLRRRRPVIAPMRSQINGDTL